MTPQVEQSQVYAFTTNSLAGSTAPSQTYIHDELRTSCLLHDLRNHLQTAASALALVRREFVSNESETCVALCEVATRSVASASAASVRLSANQDGTVDPADVIDVDGTLHACAPALRTALGDAISLYVAAASGLKLRCSAHDLANALLNLATNAREAMPFGGRLIVTALAEPVDTTEHGVCIAVRDTGVGMTPQDCARACQPHFTTKAEPGPHGRGLGLTSVRAFAHGLGGEVEISSEQGIGTEVRLRIPACPPVWP